MTDGPWGSPEKPKLTLPARRIHLSAPVMLQGTAVNGTYLAVMWFLMLPLLLAQPVWLMVLGFIVLGISALYSAFTLFTIWKLFIFGMNVLDTRRS